MKLLPVVMVRAPHQQEQVIRWLKYVKALNPSYQITVLDCPISNETKPSRNKADDAFRYALEQFKNRAFLWVEPDSIPLTSAWLSLITAEYHECGKAFMLPRLEQGGDIGSGIGVYPRDAHWLIPEEFTVHAWDAWVYRNLKQAIHFTDLIQHSYGVYDGLFMTRRHSFPKDKDIIKKDAVLFHADPMQTLIREMPVMYHTGDIGDLVAALPILKYIGGGEICIGPVATGTPAGHIPRQGFENQDLDKIYPLLKMQSYVTDAYFTYGKSDLLHIDYDLSLFRLLPRTKDESLLQWQARALGFSPLNENQWITCGGYATHDRVIMSRSPRYHNPLFPWKAIVQFYNQRPGKPLFIGLEEEHEDFQKEVGIKVERANTATLLDVAKLIMGAPIGFYNQSAPFWIAAGLGSVLVQESWIGGELNAIIKRPNASYITSDLYKIAKLLNLI